MTRHRPLFLLVLLVLAATLAAQEEPRNLLIDLRGLGAALEEDPPLELDLPLLQSLIEGGDVGFDLAQAETSYPNDEIVELIRLSGALDLDGDDRCWLPDEGLLQLAAPAERLARARELIAFIQGRMLRDAEIELIEIDGEAMAEIRDPRLDAAALRALLARHPARTRTLHHVRLGRRSTLRSGQASSIMSIWHGEVAAKARIASPETRSVFAGLEASIWIAPRCDGRFRLDLALRSAQPILPSRSVAETATRIGRIELPRCATQIDRVSVDLAAGEALVLGSNEERGALRIVRLRQVAPEPVAPASLEVLPTIHLSRPMPSAMLPVITRAGVDSQRLVVAAEDRESEPVAPYGADGLIGLLSEQLYDSDEGVDEGELASLLGELWMMGPAVRRAALRQTLASVSRQQDRSIVAELRWGVLEVGELDQFDQGHDALADRLPNRRFVTTRLGDAALALAGQENAYLRAKEVAIAEDAVLAVPVVDCLFEGFACRLLPSALADDRIAIAAELVYQREDGPVQANDSGLVEIGSVDRVSAQRAEARPRVALERGTWCLLTLAQLSGSSDCLAVMIRLR